MFHLKNLFFLLFAFSCALSSYADQDISFDEVSPVDKLSNLDYRPTALEFLEAFNGEIPPINPFLKGDKKLPKSRGYTDNTRSTLKQVQKFVSDNMPVLAEAIANLEFVYPNAIYMPMGRDAAYLADALDFFYTSMGESNKVRRLRASGPTIRALTAKTGPQFLLSNGFAQEKDKAYIFIDNTTFSSNSQSRILFNFGTKILLENGVNKDDIYKHMAVASPYGWWPKEGEEYLSRTKLMEQVKANNKKQPFYISTGGMLYGGGFWHPSSGSDLITLSSGEIAGAYYQKYSASDRLQVLAYIYEVMKAANSIEFLDLVISELEKRGVKNRFSREKHIEIKFKELTPEELEQLRLEEEKEKKLKEERQQKAVVAAFRRQLGAAISKRIMPTQVKYQYNPGTSFNKIDLLTKDEAQSLQDAYTKYSEANASDKSINLISSEIEKLFSVNASNVVRFENLVERLPELEESHIKFGVSLQYYTLYGWLVSYSHSKAARGEDVPEFFNLLAKAFRAGKIKDVEFLRLSSYIFSFMPTGLSEIEKDKMKKAILNQKAALRALMPVFRAQKNLIKAVGNGSLYEALNRRDKNCDDVLKAG